MTITPYQIAVLVLFSGGVDGISRPMPFSLHIARLSRSLIMEIGRFSLMKYRLVKIDTRLEKQLDG
jgi:hypothetical protein